MARIKLVRVLFCFLALITGFFLGIGYAVVTGVAEGQGLAGGAIILGNGVIGGVLVFVLALFFSSYVSESHIWKWNKVLISLITLIVVVLIVRVNMIEREEDPETPTKAAPTEVVGSVSKATPVILNFEENQVSGLGMFKPNFFDTPVLYFYDLSNLTKGIIEHFPIDSIGFVRTEKGYDIAYAPPWLVPHHLKLDYDILFFRVESIGEEFLEIVVNEHENRTAFVSRQAGRLLYWPDFLLQVNSIEAEDRQNNPVRIKPLAHSDPITTDYAFLRPIHFRNEWVYVELITDDYQELGKGWLRWRKDGMLMVAYSLLS